MPFTDDTYSLPDGSLVTTGLRSAASQHNTPLNDIADALTIVKTAASTSSDAVTALEDREIATGTGLTGGGTLAASRTVALSSASIASLALADSAVQPEDLGTAATKDVDFFAAADAVLLTVVPGQSTSIDNTDPQNPVINFTGTGTGDMLAANDLSDLSSASTARDNLGLGTAAVIDTVDEDDMASDSATKVPTQQSVKAYHDLRRNAHSVLEYGTVDLTGATSSQTAVAAAVAAAWSGGFELYWPAGTYLTTASIPNLHDVRHSGPGVIKRGTGTFRVEQKTGTNNLYVSASGDDDNDGLTSSQPMATIQGVIDVLSKYPRPLRGLWKVALAAGSYGGAEASAGLVSENNITIQGPAVGGHPNVPTALVKKSEDTGKTHGFYAKANTSFYVKDVKFQDFTGSGNGVSSQDGASIYLDNVHTYNCFQGVKSQQGRMRIAGGIHDSHSSSGIVSLGLNLHTIGYGATSTADAPVVSNCGSVGILLQENATGHVSAAISDCPTGIDAVANSRANLDHVSITDCTTGLRMRVNSTFADVDDVTFSGCAVNVKKYAGSDATEEGTNTPTLAPRAIDTTSASLTGSTDNTYIKSSVHTLQGGTFNYVGRTLRIRVQGSFTGTAGTKTLLIYFNAATVSSVVTATASAAGDYVYEAVIAAVSQTERVGSSELRGTSAQNIRVSNNRNTTDIGTGDVTVRVGGKLSDASDTITIDKVEVWETG